MQQKLGMVVCTYLGKIQEQNNKSKKTRRHGSSGIALA
jgi:hypothetical protein